MDVTTSGRHRAAVTRAHRIAAPAALADHGRAVGLGLRRHPRGRARARLGAPVGPAARRSRRSCSRRSPSVRRVGWPARRDLPLLALCALSGMTAYQVLLNAGEVTVPAATASLLVNVAPIFTALLAAALLGERLTRDGLGGRGARLRGRRAIARGRRRRRCGSRAARCSCSARRPRRRPSSSPRRRCCAATAASRSPRGRWASARRWRCRSRPGSPATSARRRPRALLAVALPRASAPRRWAS